MIFRVLVLLFFYLQLTYANVILTDTTKKYTDFSISYLYDETGDLSIDDIANSSFTQNIPSQFTLGYTNKNIWFKLIVENKSATRDFVLCFSEPFWAKFDLFKKAQNGWTKEEAGLLTPLGKREIEDVNPAFPITLNRGQSKIFYVNAQTVNGNLGAFEIFKSKEYFRPGRITLNTFYQLYSSVLLIIIILNFLLLLEMRERIYAYYIGYVSAYIVFVSMFSSSYLYLDFSGWNHGLHTVGAVVLMFMSLFSNSFLELDKYFPKVDKIFKLFTLIFVLFALMMGLNIPNFTFIFNIFAFVFMTSLLVMAVKTWQDGRVQARYYLYALIIYMPTMGMMALTFDGFLPNTDLTRYSFLLGALVEIILFSLILASRFHIAKYDRIRFQEELLVEKQKNEEYLEAEIKRQKYEIEKTSAMIIQQSRLAQMGEMISMIAHQWRQPLGAISTTSVNLQMKLELQEFDSTNQESMKEWNKYLFKRLENIDDYVQNLTTTIDDFRNFYKPNKKSVNIKLEEVILKSLNIIRSSFINNDIEIIEEYNSNQEIELYDNELMQVILNILKNAQDNFIEKALKDTASHKIENPKIVITTQEKSISIYDNGGGIPEDIIDVIFDPYFSTKDEKNGTGLGLYMSKIIIEEHHNGKLIAKNRDDGVCFSIELGKIE